MKHTQRNGVKKLGGGASVHIGHKRKRVSPDAPQFNFMDYTPSTEEAKPMSQPKRECLAPAVLVDGSGVVIWRK